MRAALQAFALMALFAALDSAAQQMESVTHVDEYPLGSPTTVIEVNGAPGGATAPVRRTALRELVYAAPRLRATDIHSPGPLTAAERSSLGATLRSGERVQVGISRSFPEPVGLDMSQETSQPAPGERVGGGLLELRQGSLVWSAGFRSPEAGAVRLRIEQITLPAGTVAFVYGRSGEVHGPYDIGGVHADPFWTNTVFATEAYLEVRFPSGLNDLSGARFTVDAIAHLEHAQFAPSVSAREAPEALPACFRDVNCASASEFPGLDDAKRAVALALFEQNGVSFVCSGALVNTTAGNAIPYFLTANHCVGNATTAKSMELFWDYRTSACGSAAPSRGEFERTLGATLLATGAAERGEADFSLLRLLQDPPAGRFYLGWSSAPVARTADTKIFRVAHPEGGPQMISRHAISPEPTPGECAGLPQSRFIYSKNELGATKGGSSGAPVFLADGLKIVGQLFGRCGNNIPDACDAVQNSAVDGAFASYFARVDDWLSPAAAPDCSPGVNTLCLFGGRFKVELTARDQRTGKSGAGVAVAENDIFGYFSLPGLSGRGDNPEVVVKVLDGRPTSEAFWVFYGGLTDLGFSITVTDSVSGIVKTYEKDAGSYCGDADAWPNSR